jgi:uncharacterized protein DUF6600/FecR-like protein
MNARRRFQWFLAALLVVGISAGSALAQDESVGNAPVMQYPEARSNAPTQYPDNGNSAPPQQYPNAQSYPNGGSNGPGQVPPQDPSGRVARLQFTSGEVSMQPGGVNDWIAASLNRPLTTSDRVWTDKNSKAELNVGDGFLRMNSETSVTLTNVSDSTVQVELDQGTLEVTVKHLEKGEMYEIDTPNYAFTVMKTGVYRFDVFPHGDESWVTVRSGYGEATGKGPAVRVNSGQQVRFTSDQTLQHTAINAPAPDGFDDWAQVRDKRLDSSLSARYVSPGVIGYQDLDAYGTWHTVAPYGSIWTPYSVPAGWAPYRYGHWVWIAPWGWTWVDDAPWGFAPFHYGRWVYWNSAWAWAPGPLGYWNPYYAPALVGWIGGAGFGVGFGWGWGGFGIGIGFGWFPLGWGVPYYPHYCGWGYGGWYHGGGWVSAGYLHNVNVSNTHITNVTNITNNYYNNNLAGIGGNRNIPGAVTAAPRSAFTSGAAINKVGTVVPKSGLNSGQLMRTADVNPTRESVLGGRTPTRVAPSASATRGNVVTQMRPPQGPARFDAAQSATSRMNAGPATQGNSNAGHAPNVGSNANLGAATHNVPRPPSAGAAVNNQTTSNQVARDNIPSNPASHTVPRPPTSNDSLARGNQSGVSNRTTASGTQQSNAGASTAQNSTVHRPPANYSYHAPSGTTQQSAPSHQSAPSEHAAPQGNSHGSGGSNSGSSSTSRAYGSTPRPPAGYTYHAAPAYSASSSYAAGRSGVSAYGGSRGYSPSPNYGSSRSYGSSPAYSARSYGSMGSYSAPHYSGGSGGGSHGGGGGHSGGGGHR